MLEKRETTHFQGLSAAAKLLWTSARAVNLTAPTCIFAKPATMLGRISFLLTIVFGATCWAPAAVRAQTLQEEELEQQGLYEQPTSGNWSVTLGAGLAAGPTYPGASAFGAQATPLVLVKYGDVFFLGPFGLGANVINWNGFRAGPVIGYEGGRSQGDDPRLNGLGDIQPSATAGIFAAYRFGPFEIAGTARQAIIHTGNGLIGLVQLDYRAPIIWHTLAFIVGADFEFADRQYDRTWFGVTTAQSALSGLPVFAPGASVEDVGLHASLTYRYSEHILLHAFTHVKELTGEIANSPIVQSRTQALVGIGAAYHF